MDVRNACLDAPAGVLPALLAALAPAGEVPRGLWLRWCGLVPSTFDGCAAHLAAAEMVAAIYTGSLVNGQSLQPALGALLHQTPLLKSLAIRCNRPYREASMPDGAPTAIPSLRHLTCLELVCASLPHIDGLLEGLPGGRSTCWVRACCGARCGARVALLRNGVWVGSAGGCSPCQYCVAKFDALILQTPSTPALPQTWLTWTSGPTACSACLMPSAVAPS